MPRPYGAITGFSYVSDAERAIPISQRTCLKTATVVIRKQKTFEMFLSLIITIITIIIR